MFGMIALCSLPRPASGSNIVHAAFVPSRFQAAALHRRLPRQVDRRLPVRMVASERGGVGNWAPFLENEGRWSGRFVRYSPDMTRLTEGATNVVVRRELDRVFINLQRDKHVGEAVFSRQQLDRHDDDVADGEGWEQQIELSVASCGTMAGSYCMGAPHIETESVSVEQSLLLRGHRIRAICSFQLTMSGPCSPDFQLSLRSLAFFQEARQSPAAEREQSEAEDGLRHRETDDKAAATGAAAGAKVFGEAPSSRWRMTAGEFVS